MLGGSVWEARSHPELCPSFSRPSAVAGEADEPRPAGEPRPAVMRPAGQWEAWAAQGLARSSPCRLLPSAAHLSPACWPDTGRPRLRPAHSPAYPRLSHSLSKLQEGEELQGFLLPSLAGRLRTAEQEAIWGGMGAVRRRQPPEDPFPPPPPSQLRQPT